MALPHLSYSLTYSVSVLLGLRRLEIVQPPADLLHGNFPFQKMIAARFFSDPFPVNGIAEMVVTLEHRGSRHLDEAGVVQWIEPAESFGNMTLRRGDAFA